VALSGNLVETSFTDLIQFYSLSRQTAAVTIISPQGPEHNGVLYIEGGDVVDARFAELEGLDAVRRALRLKEGEFRVELNVKAKARTIFEPWSKLVLQELVSSDEEQYGNGIRTDEADDDEADDDGPEPGSQPLVPVEERSMEMSESLKVCPVCRRQYLRGTTCQEDGALLVEAGAAAAPMSGVGRTSSPPRGTATSASRPPMARSHPPQAPLPPKKSKTVPILIGAIVVAGAGAAAFLLLRPALTAPESGQQRTARSEPASSPSATPSAGGGRRASGVTDGEILFGMAAPFSGPAKELGRGMKTGVDLAFGAANATGGVHGRKLKLIALDDGYEPERTRTAMKELLEQRGVFAIVGNVGTPTAEVSVPLINEHKVLFFAPFTGAGMLRKDPPDRYVFNYRASYTEETAAIVSYLVEVRRLRTGEIAVLTQEDGYGEAGFQGVAKVMRRYRRDPASVLRVGYKRNTADIGDAAAAVIKNGSKTRAVVMVATYKAAAKFIEKVKDARPDMIFTNVSFVGSTALAEELMGIGPKFAEGTIVTQVVPVPTSKSTAVMKYQELLPKYSLGERPDFVSLEGYLAGSVLIDALQRAGRELDTEKLINALEQTKGLDLGVGATMSFGMSEHQASHKVWGTVLDAQGTYQPLELN
jgi:ABC-type branched-subunit amino acid transport system substrate-binding protein